MNRLTISSALERLKEVGQEYSVLFEHGSLAIGIYAPEKQDYQQPHTRDEVYVIASGSGYFVNGDNRQSFETGEVFFVPAGTVHRFEDFSDGFSTWVFFYGPEGGERK